MDYLELPAPLNLAAEDAALFQRLSRCKQFSDSGVLHLQDVLATYSGVVMNGWSPLAASYHREEEYIAKEARRIALFHYLTRPRKRLPDHTTYVIAHTLWVPGYYAWLHNTLPRLQRIEEQLSEATLLLPESCRRLAPSLAVFSIGQIVYLSRKRLYKIRRLILPDGLGSGAHLGKAALHALRSRYTEFAARESTQKQRAARIFITRKDARSRRITNEAEVIQLLEKYDFQMVELGEMDFWEQVNTFRAARFVIGTHGAGLSNNVFMPAGTALLELLPMAAKKGNYRAMYYHMAGTLGLHYAYQFCPTRGEEAEIYHHDLFIDLQQLKKNIEGVLLQLS